MSRWDVVKFDMSELVGKTFKSVSASKGDEEMVLISTDGIRYTFYHQQDCCESVDIDDIDGNVESLVGETMLMAEEVTNVDDAETRTFDKSEWIESYTWTFYKFATIKGYVTVKWLGRSNDYYSESVDRKKETFS